MENGQMKMTVSTVISQRKENNMDLSIGCYECAGEDFETVYGEEIASWGDYSEITMAESSICKTCGEKLFSMDVVQQLQKIAQEGSKRFKETGIYQNGQIIQVDNLMVDFTNEGDLFVIESSYYDEENNLYYSIRRLSDGQVWIDLSSSQIIY